MTIILLLLASTILGLATGLFFRVWALLPVSLAIAIASAFVLRSCEVGFVAGVLTIVGCLVASQFAYMAMTFHLYRGKLSVQDETDGSPGECRKQKICKENK